ncbi:OadG family protein [Thermovorax subterraneus]|nr:OadG family protein [Thermovorax subterraneus]
MSDVTKALAESLKTGLLGMGITLISLYILSIILDLMKVIFYKKEKEENKVGKNEQEAASNFVTREKAVLEEKEEPEAVEEGEEQLVAVITAALAAYLGKPQDMIKIGFIRRIHERTPAWGMESRLNPLEHPLLLQNRR